MGYPREPIHYMEKDGEDVIERRTFWGIFSMKVKYVHLDNKFGERVREILSMFPEAKYIHLVRLNKVAQGLSRFVVEHTNVPTIADFSRYTSVDTSCVKYDFDQLRKCITTKAKDDLRWKKYFEAHDISPLTIYYEELCEAPGNVIEQIGDFMGVVPQLKQHIEVTKKIRDATYAELTKRYKLECQERGLALYDTADIDNLL